MKATLELTKNSLKEIYLLLFNHWRKLVELCILFIVISTLISVLIAFLVASAGNFLYFTDAPISLESLPYSYEQTHLLEISTSIYFVNTSIFAIFLLKYKEDIAKTRIKHVFQLNDTKLFSSWFLGVLFISGSELIFYNDFLGTNTNSNIMGILSQFEQTSPLDSWINSIINLLQRSLPLLAAIYIVATYLVPQFKIKDFKKIIKPIITSFLLVYAASTVYYSFSQDLDTYLFRLLLIPFESYWIYFLIVFSITILLQASLFTIVGGAIAFPLSNNFNTDITDKAEKITFNDDEILDNQ